MKKVKIIEILAAIVVIVSLTYVVYSVVPTWSYGAFGVVIGVAAVWMGGRIGRIERDLPLPVIQAQSDAIAALTLRLVKCDQERDLHIQTIANRDARIKQLEVYFADLGVNLSVIDNAVEWWPQAKKAIAVHVKPELVGSDPTFADNRQREYVMLIAKAAIGETV